MIPSQRLYLLACLAIIPLAVSAWYPLAVRWGVALDAIIVLLFLLDIRMTVPPQSITVSRRVDDRLSIGRENTVYIDIGYTGGTALDARLKDDCPAGIRASVESFRTTIGENNASAWQGTLQYNLSPDRRGVFSFGNVTLRYMSRLGLFERQRTYDLACDVKVYSDLKALQELSVKLSHSNELGELRQRKRGQGTDFAALREYASGDDARAIDWRATARRDRPVLRTYETEQEQRLLIVIDAGRMMVSDLEGLTRFDRALNAALCLALTGLYHNDQVGIGIFADKPLLYLPPKRGKTNMNRILEATFAVQPRMVEPDYAGILAYYAGAQKGRSLMAVLTDLTDPVGSQSLLSGLASLAPRHLPFCITLKDREINQIAQSAINDKEMKKRDERDEETHRVYRKAVAQDLIAQRDLALSVLTRRGCLVLDAAPQELSDKLIEKYIDVKARGKL